MRKIIRRTLAREKLGGKAIFLTRTKAAHARVLGRRLQALSGLQFYMVRHVEGERSFYVNPVHFSIAREIEEKIRPKPIANSGYSYFQAKMLPEIRQKEMNEVLDTIHFGLIRGPYGLTFPGYSPS
jgi:hypothetical protein